MADGRRRAGGGVRDAAGARDARLHARLHPAGGVEHHARHLQRRRDVERPRGVDPAVGDRAGGVHGRDGVEVPQAAPRHARGLGARGDVRGRRVLRAARVRPCQPVRGGCCGVARVRRPGPEPAAAEPRARAVPPADPVPRLRRIHRAVRVRDRGARHRPRRRGMADGDPSLGAVRVGLPHRRHPARRLVELRGARLVGRVGLGSGRERFAAAVAHRHRVHPLGARAAASRHAARVEPEPARGHVRAHDPRHVPHAVGRGQQRARVRHGRGRRVPARASSGSSPWCRSGSSRGVATGSARPA